MNGVKWISIATDIFNDEKMCAIESLPDGQTIELVWLKLLCLAGTCNESGFLMISKEIPYTDEMIAKYFRMDIGVIKRALEVFQQMGMLYVIDEIYIVSNWAKYQNESQLEHIRLMGKLRQQKHREKQKLLLEKKSNVTDNVTDNVTCNEFCSICNMYYLDVYKEIIDYLNNKSKKNYRYTTKKIQTLIHARCEEKYTIDDFKKVIDVKCTEWLGTDMEKYLRPETLFASSHFDSYLNQSENKYTTGSAFDHIDIGE